ncbi:MAG: hypothetical protein ACYTE5_07145 [Planctomycetota bacterium]|jgi:hypothetical protein
MEAEKNHKEARRKRSKIKIVVWVLVCVVILFFLVIALLPWLVSSESGRKMMLAKINDSVDGEVDFAGLSMGWFKGVRLTDVSFTDSSGRISVAVNQVAARPHYGSILKGGLSLGETIIDGLRVELDFEGLQAEPSEGFVQETGSDQEQGMNFVPVKEVDLVVNDGSLKVTDRGGGRVEVAGINCGLAVNAVGGYREDELLAGLNAKGKLGFERAEYMGFDFGRTEVDAQIQNGVLKIAPFSTVVNNGQLNFAGEANFKQKPALLKTTAPIHIVRNIQINDQTTERLLMYLNPVFAGAVNVSGVANFSCEQLAIPLAEGAENDIVVVGTISIEQLRLQASGLLDEIISVIGAHRKEQVITVRPTKFILRDGFVRYDDMQMDVGDNPVNFKGVIGLDKSLNMTVTLPYTFAGRTVRVGEADAGDRVSVLLGGTLDKPELDLGRLLQEQLLEMGLRELFK